MPFEMKYSYSTMPKSRASTEGMQLLEGDVNNVRAMLPEDIIYANKDGKNLILRMIYPQKVTDEEKSVKRPLIIHIQGSAWFAQNMNDHVMDMKEFVTAGYIAAIVQYRDSTMVKIPGQAEDAKTAVRYLYEHADELGIDTGRMFMSGDSSGGHTCLLCWASWPVRGLMDENDEPLPKITAFLDFYGPVDLLSMTEQTSAMDHIDMSCPESQAMGCQAIDPNMQERVKACSVLSYIDPQVLNAPLLILHGNKDRLVPFEQSVLLYESCKAAKKDSTFYAVNNADHGGAAFYCTAFYETVLKYLKSFEKTV